MSLRTGANLVLGLLAALRLAFAVLALVAMAQVGRGVAEQVVDAVTALLVLWALAASVAFSGATLTWLSRFWAGQGLPGSTRALLPLPGFAPRPRARSVAPC